MEIFPLDRKLSFFEISCGFSLYLNITELSLILLLSFCRHKNAQVRKVCARFLVRLAEKMGDTKLLSGSKDITEKILPVAAKFALDGQQETRWAKSFLA